MPKTCPSTVLKVDLPDSYHRNLSGMNAKFLGDLLHGFQPLEGFQGHTGLELRVMSFAFVLHGLCLGSGYAAPSHNHHNRIP